jgi:hypothetical protein
MFSGMDPESWLFDKSLQAKGEATSC